MSLPPTDIRVQVLTPAGTGAIATVAVVGPKAWEVVRAVFRPVGGSLPEVPPVHRVYFGTLGENGDEVVVGVKDAERVEVHCHGGRRVVRWVVEQLTVSRVPSDRSPAPRLSASRPSCSTN